MKLVLATRNPHKVFEMRELLSGLDVEVLSCQDFPGVPEVVEDGDTLMENAVKKARVVAEATGLPALADDTGLEVEALGGQPGVFSARYAGESATYDDNNRKLLRALVGLPAPNRRACFKCVVALALPGGIVTTAAGLTWGTITTEPRGTAGFGYDPVFLADGSERTYAELSSAEKHAVSHRGKAMAAARELVRAARE
jgi:XTP/dITP diphosphohydrolase